MLLATESLYPEETNWWGDTFWWVCEGQGLNLLGKCLMLVRGSPQDRRALFQANAEALRQSLRD